MKSIRRKLAAAFVLIMILYTACTRKTQTQAEVPEFVLSYAENQSEDYPTTLGGYKFAELVEKKSGGRIKIRVQAEGVLGNEKEVIEQLQFGGIDFARISLSQLAETVPGLNVLQMPYLYENAEHMWKVLDSAIGEDFLKITEGFDMIGLSWYDAGARNFYNAVRPITCLKDMQGLKIRVQESQMMKDMVEAMGAAAVPITYDEVYSRLEQGVVDGAENNWPSYESTAHYKAARYYTVDEHVRIPEMQLCARATWEKLSPEDQQIIYLCARESALYERQLWAEREKSSRAAAVAAGVKVTDMSEEEKAEFKKAVAGIYEKYCKEDMELIEKIRAMGK